MGATGRDLHIDKHLSNVAMNYRPMNMIADLIAPIVPVGKQSDSYPVWSQADALRVEEDKRSPGKPANLITRDVSTDTYFADNYALKTALTLEDRENMDDAFIKQLRDGKATFLKGKVVLGWEYRVAMQVTSGSNVGSYSTVISDWMDTATGNSTPLKDVQTALDNVQDSTGYRPNRLIFGELAWRWFRRHADVIDILYGDTGQGSPRYASREQIKAIFEVDQFLVGGAYYNTAEEGQALSLTPLWLDNVLAYYCPSAPSIDEPSFTYSFRWTKPGLPNMGVERHPFDTKTKSEEVEIGYYQDEKITSAPLGFLITNVTSV